MTNRREVLQMGLGVTLLPLDAATAWAVPAGTAREEKAIPLYKALYDMRFPASRVFGERMTVRGVPVAALTTGDMTSLWFDDLHHQWKKGPMAISGLTARGPLFCLEQLAWEHGMRVVFRARHSLTNEGSILHEIEGTDAAVEAAKRVAVDEWWAAGFGDVIGYYAHTNGKQVSAQAATARSAVALPEEEALFSWVIAPVVRG